MLGEEGSGEAAGGTPGGLCWEGGGVFGVFVCPFGVSVCPFRVSVCPFVFFVSLWGFCVSLGGLRVSLWGFHMARGHLRGSGHIFWAENSRSAWGNSNPHLEDEKSSKWLLKLVLLGGLCA